MESLASKNRQKLDVFTRELERLHRDKRVRDTETLWDKEELLAHRHVSILDYEDRVDTVDL